MIAGCASRSVVGPYLLVLITTGALKSCPPSVEVTITIVFGLKNGDVRGRRCWRNSSSRPCNIDVSRSDIRLNLTSRRVREAGNVTVNRHRRLECLVTRWQPLIDDIEGSRATKWLLKPHGNRGIPRKRELLQDERTAVTTPVVLVKQDIKVAVSIETQARIGNLQIGNSRIRGIRIRQNHTGLERSPGLTAIDRIIALDKNLRSRGRYVRSIVVHPNRHNLPRIKRIHSYDCDCPPVPQDR